MYPLALSLVFYVTYYMYTHNYYRIKKTLFTMVVIDTIQ